MSNGDLVDYDPYALPQPRAPTHITVTPGAAPPKVPVGDLVDYDPYALPQQTEPSTVYPWQGAYWDRQLIENENILDAAKQATTSNIDAHAKNLLGNATVDEDGNVNYVDQSGAPVLTDQNKHIVLTDPADGKPKVFARTSETDEPYGQASARALVQGMGAGPVLVGSTAAERIGAQIPLALRGRIPRFITWLAEKFPGGGALTRKIGEAPQQVERAATEAASTLGGGAPATRQEATRAFEESRKQAFEQTVPGQIKEAWATADEPVTTPSTAQARAEQRLREAGRPIPPQWRRTSEVGAEVEALKKEAAQAQQKLEGIVGHNVPEQLRRMASTEGADLDTLKLARRAAGERWGEITSNIVNNLGRDAQGKFNPAKFVDDYRALSDEGKNILFGSAGKRAVIPFLNDVAETSAQFRRQIAAGHTSPVIEGLKHGGAGALGFGAAEQLLEHPGTLLQHATSFEGLAALAAWAGISRIPKMLSAPATAASTARWVRAWHAYVHTPTPQTLTNLNISTRNLAGTAGLDPVEARRKVQEQVAQKRP
jgi:hypothetical protein